MGSHRAAGIACGRRLGPLPARGWMPCVSWSPSRPPGRPSYGHTAGQMPAESSRRGCCGVRPQMGGKMSAGFKQESSSRRSQRDCVRLVEKTRVGKPWGEAGVVDVSGSVFRLEGEQDRTSRRVFETPERRRGKSKPGARKRCMM